MAGYPEGRTRARAISPTKLASLAMATGDPLYTAGSSRRSTERYRSKGHSDMEVTMTIIVYHGMVWVVIGPSCTTEATVDPMRVNNLVDARAQAVHQARGDIKWRLVVDRCDDLEFSRSRTLDVCGRFVLSGCH